MNKRLQVIFSEIPKCSSFADVGCDHGYIAEAVLSSGKCQSVVVSDISAPSLEKAKKLLKKYIDCGKATAVLCDGLKLVPPCETVLIAGMGGEETIKILSEAPFSPEKLLLSPMKNQDKVRRFLEKSGYGIIKDYVFSDERFYHVIYAEKGISCEKYTEKEFAYGRTNLNKRSADFIAYLNKELEKALTYKSKVASEKDAAAFDEKISELKGILSHEN